MNIDKLYDILNKTTVQLRKGEALLERDTPGGLHVTEIFFGPQADELADDSWTKVDLELLVVGVKNVEAQACKGDLIELLKAYPQPDRLADGPSYIEVGAEIGDQGAAFQLFALGKVLGLWDVITPGKMGITGPQAEEMAGSGFIMITGFRV